MTTKITIEDDLLNEILEKANISGKDIAVPKYNISYRELVKTLIEEDGTKGASIKLGLTKSALETRISRYLRSKLPNKSSTSKWSLCFLNLVNKSKCSKCGFISDLVDIRSGKNNTCKRCISNTGWNYYLENKDKVLLSAKKYRDNNPVKIKESYNKWADNNKGYLKNKSVLKRLKLKTATYISYWESEELISFYDNCPVGYEVDHIVPLNHPLVCGLHTLCNLQYLSKADNMQKSNRFILDE